MKRLSSILLLLIIPIVVIGQNLKALDEKNGFREAKFGMSPSSFKKLESAQVKGPPIIGLRGDTESKGTTVIAFYEEKSYIDKNVDLHIGNFPLDYVEYYFYKNKLVTIEIKVSQGLTNQNGVLEVLEAAYGQGVFVKNDNLHPISYSTWEGEKVKMVYTLGNDLEIVGIRISISSKELKNWEKEDIIIEEKKIEQQKQHAIQDAAKKL